MKTPPNGTVGARFEALVELIARLRSPGGCPWDREQTHESLKATTIEEAYEVLEAIDGQDDQELEGELGDLLLQVVFHSQIASEGGRFTVDDVIRHVSGKMVRRHPHVFGTQSAASTEEVLRNWEALKAQERQSKGAAGALLDSISSHLPAVMEAHQVATRVARVGFDWPDARAVLDKLREELGELEDVLSSPQPERRRVLEELGDLLFTAVNVARLLDSDAESVLKTANRKFRRRFAQVEQSLRARGEDVSQADPRELERLWEQAKQSEEPPP